MADVSARQDTSAVICLCLAGCVLLGFAIAAPWIVARFEYAVFIPALAASGLVTIFATRCAVHVPARSGLMIVLGFALAIRLALVGIEPLLSTDLYRYIWDGRVQAAGFNPYRYVPADAALAALRDAAIYPNINRADYAVTAYPPLAEMFFIVVSRMAETATMMRLAMVGCEVVIVAIVIGLLRRLALPVTTVVAYAWHPLAVFEIANNGHVEALMVALMMLGVWLLVRAHRVGGAVAVTLAALAKPYAVLVLPAFWRPWDWRVPLAIVATILICYLPYLGAGKAVLGFLGQGYLQEEGFVSGTSIWIVALLQTVLGPVTWLTPIYAAAAAAIMIALGLRHRFDPDRSPR
ncbi:MAG TPA: glycosyltransferase 87 family protein, partial [Xanthobacteraceae bacterium]|nr:glycosyltransferase 87 family protein [Xanthobacteraceae bacterium]